ncbi:MAG: peptidylprolyl isomerase [Candidatus Limnocylindrales bacterium]
MTIRPVKAERPRRRGGVDSEDRFQFLVTVGFVALVALVAVILVGSVALSYYNSHLKPVATVGGIGITRDQWADRSKLGSFRIVRAEAAVRRALAAGQIDEATAQSRLDSLSTAADNVDSQAISDLIDLIFQEQLAVERGITLTDADVDAAIDREATTPERRQVQAIFVAPETTDGVTTPDQDVAAATKAREAVTALGTGMPWAQAAQIYSTDASNESGGEYGFLTSENATDKAWVEAVFALPLNGTTEIIKGEDGTYRIGRVTSITPALNDRTVFLSDLTQYISMDTYRANIRREKLSVDLRESVTDAALAGEVDQVHVAEIVIAGSTAADEATNEGEIRASHILYSPKDDPQGAGDLAADDPAWATAQAEAQATADQMKAIADPTARATAFADLAKTASDDTTSGINGGDLDWFGRAQMVPEFGDPLFDHPELVTGDIVGPVKSDFGWHVILFVGRRASTEDRLQAVLDRLGVSGGDFAAIARELSDGDTAADGGDLGWKVRAQLPTDAQDDVYGLRPGTVSREVTLDDGYHIYRMLERGNRALDPVQVPLVRESAFSDWYGVKKTAAQADGTITQDPDVFPPTDPSTDVPQ